MHYVLRISATWHVSQFLLFRDLEDPDLWLGTDGHGRWGEMNGDHRIDLDGCVDLDLDCTPFTSILPIRRNSLHVGDSVELAVVAVDVEKLDLQPGRRRYTRLEPRRWQVDFLDTGTTQLFEVDEFGLPLDHPDGFCRLS